MIVGFFILLFGKNYGPVVLYRPTSVPVPDLTMKLCFFVKNLSKDMHMSCMFLIQGLIVS